MKYLACILFVFLTACVPGKTPPGARGGDSSPFLPPPPEEEGGQTETTLPDISFDPVGRRSVETRSNTANVFNYDPGSFSYTLTGTVFVETVDMDPEGKLKYNDTDLEELESAKIQLVDAQSDVVVAETFITNGTYQFLINDRRIVYLRIIAETDSPTIRVLDNTAGNQPYFFETDYFDLVNSPIRNFIVNLNFNGSLFYANSHTTTHRPGDSFDEDEGIPQFLGGSIADSFSAPFGILNNYYRMYEKVNGLMLATNRISSSTLDNSELDIYWNAENSATVGHYADGEIGSAHYNPLLPGIFLKGQVNVDSDEWDDYLQAKLFAYHILDTYSRGEFYSIDYDENKILQPGQLFPHVFAQFFSARYSTQPPDFYRESGGLNGQTVLREIDFNNNLLTNRQWFHFEAARKFMWDLFDDVDEGLDYSSLNENAIFDVLLDPDFKQDSHPVNFYKFIHFLKANNSNQEIFINHLSSYYSYEEDWGPTGPTATDQDLPAAYSSVNPLLKPFPEIFIDDGSNAQGYTTLTVNKNNGECAVAGSETYLRFYPISQQTKVELIKSDLMTIEILREGRIVWNSSNDDDEIFLLNTPDATLSGAITEDESPFYILKVRSHPGASANNATLNVKLHTNHIASPGDNIANQFIFYTIGIDGQKIFRVPAYVNRCHRNPVIARYRFNSIPENNVRLFLRFNSEDNVGYKIIINGSEVINNETRGVRDHTHILNYNDSIQTSRRMEIQISNDFNLYRDFNMELQLDYLPF